MSRERKLRLEGDGGLHALRIEPAGEGYRTESGTTVTRGSESSSIWSVVTPDGGSFEACVEARDSEIEVAIGSARFRFAVGVAPPNVARRGSSSGRIEVKSPMPGRVVKILVASGQSVLAGQPILLFEAMKMQNELRCPEAGVVSEVAVEAGQAIEGRELLYVLTPTL